MSRHPRTTPRSALMSAVLAAALVLAGVGAVSLAGPALRAEAAVPAPTCPAVGSMPGIGGDPTYTDATPAVFVGGDYRALGEAAESEGLLVVLGDATFSKFEGPFNVGSVGVGSGIVPPPGTPMLKVGGQLTVTPATEPNPTSLEVGANIDGGGDVRVGGAVSGTVATYGGSVEQGLGAAAALSPDGGRLAEFQAVSTDLAGRAPTGATTIAGPGVTFTGTGAALEIFRIDAAQLSATTEVTFTGIAANAPIVVDVVGGPVTYTPTYTELDGVRVDVFGPDFGNAASRILWNFPTATAVSLEGTSQLMGSILAPNADLSTTMSTNGRVLIGGDFVTQGTGNEQHNYPWIGGLGLQCRAAIAAVGGFQATKVVAGSAAASVPAETTFALEYSYTNGDGVPVAGVLSLRADGTTVSGPQDLPAGTVVSFSESAPPAVPGVVWGTPSISPSSVTVAADTSPFVTVTNTATPAAPDTIDLTIDKLLASGAGPYEPGDEVTFDLVVTNNGPATARSGFTVTDRLPAGLEFVSAVGDSWSDATVTGGEVSATWEGVPLAAAGTASPITVTALVSSVDAGVLRNVAVVEPATDETAVESIPVGTAPDRFENGDAAPSAGNPSNNDDGVDLTVVVPALSLGNRLWFDEGAGTDQAGDGTVDLGEPPVVGAVVELLDGAGAPVLDDDGAPVTTTTDAAGFYRFDGLGVSAYRVRVAASNFTVGGPLAGYFSSTPTSTDFDTASNNTDKGTDTTDPAATGVVSAVVTLAAGGQPEDEVDAGAAGAGANGPFGDAFDNLTVDFGFVQPYDLTLAKTVTSKTTPYALGDTVTYDLTVSNNGPGIAVSGLTVSDLLPAGLAFVSAVGSNWTLVDEVGPEVTLRWIGGDLDQGASAAILTVTARVTTETPGTLVNAAVVEPSPDQRTPESIPIGTTPDKYENSDPTPAAGSPSNNDAGAAIAVTGPTYAVGDRVWLDADRNGREDPDEPAVGGVLVTLLTGDGTPAVDADGAPVAPATTDAAGHYVFDALLPGEYRVRFSGWPAGYRPAPQSALGTTSADDSTADATGLTPPFTLSASGLDVRAVAPTDGVTRAVRINPTIDLGLVPESVVGGGGPSTSGDGPGPLLPATGIAIPGWAVPLALALCTLGLGLIRLRRAT